MERTRPHVRGGDDTIGRATGAALLLAAVLLPLALYLRTLPPSITWWFGGSDSGDLISAADALGIPHPTGYPLFVLLGYLATRIPVGEVAGRMNALNALLGALGAGGIALTVATLARGLSVPPFVRPLAGLFAAVAVATSGLYWSQAIIGEVYILQAALTALILVLWARPGVHPLARGAAHGLALTNHLTGVIVLGAALVTFVRPWDLREWRTSAWFGAGLAAALSLYLLLPLRAAQDPIANWGDPDTLSRFLTHVTGSQYRRYLAWGDLPGALADLASLLRLMLGDLPPWSLPFMAVGLYRLGAANGRYAAFSGLTFAGTFLFTSLYGIVDRAPYLLPAYVVAGVWCGYGLVIAAQAALAVLREPGRPALIGAAAAAAVALQVVWTARTFDRVDLSGDDSAVVFARTTLDALPPNATYYSGRDDVTFSLWYAQRSLGLRRDVRVVDVRNTSLRGLP